MNTGKEGVPGVLAITIIHHMRSMNTYIELRESAGPRELFPKTP